MGPFEKKTPTYKTNNLDYTIILFVSNFVPRITCMYVCVERTDKLVK